MDEIIKVTGEAHQEYEELLLRRDKLRKEAYLLQAEYMAEFGDAITALFEKKIACIKKKKMISYCQVALNTGNKVDQEAMQAYLEQEMREYNQRLKEMIQENEAAHSMEHISAGTLAKIKKLYHRLAKQLHPDINPKTNEIPELKALWNLITVSYNANDLEELEEAEVLVNRALENAGIAGMEIEIHDVRQKMEQIREEILKIKSTNPYQYKFLLRDPQQREEKREQLRRELDEYLEYEKQLDQMLDAIVASGAGFVWHMNP